MISHPGYWCQIVCVSTTRVQLLLRHFIISCLGKYFLAKVWFQNHRLVLWKRFHDPFLKRNCFTESIIGESHRFWRVADRYFDNSNYKKAIQSKAKQVNKFEQVWGGGPKVNKFEHAWEGGVPMWVEEGAGCPQVNKSERLMVTWGPSKAVNINKLMAILVTILNGQCRPAVSIF